YLPAVGCGADTTTVSGCRANPLSWVVPANTISAGSIANPATGYPLVGTTNALLYTCYNSAAKRGAVMSMAALHFGKVAARDEKPGVRLNAALSTSTGKGADGTPLGILGRNGIAAMPTTWKNAIWETFCSKVHKTTNSPDSLKIFIQDKLKTK